VVGVSNYSNYITFFSSSHNEHDYPRAVLYIYKHLLNFHVFFFINVYSDNDHSALKYFKNTKANIQNVLIMAGNFNIKDSN